LQKLYSAQLNLYLNFNRPCGFATVSLDARVKHKRRYKLEDLRHAVPETQIVRAVFRLPQGGNRF
jgi:hypothetical protein